MKLTEQDVFAPFIGKPVNNNFSNWFKASPRGYSLHIAAKYCDDMFGTTASLRDYWDCCGIDLDLILTLEQGVIVSGFVDKLRCSSSGHGRPSVRVLKPTQQELRIARRILQYITI